MKFFIQTLALLAMLTPRHGFGQDKVNPFELCKDVDPSFDRKKLGRNETAAMQFDACIALSRIQCVEGAEVLVKTYKILLDAYTGDARKNRPTTIGLVGDFPATEINVNIFDNFRALKVHHTEVFQEIIKAQKEFEPIIDAVKSAEDAQAARKTLAERVKSIRNSLTKASHYDRVFLNLIDQSQEEITNVVLSAQGVLGRANCSILREPVDKIAANSNEYVQKVTALKSYVAKSTLKRSLALEKFQRGTELAIYTQYGASIGESLDQIMDEIGAVFTLDGILWELTDWWASATIRGLAGRLHTEYLQYKEPLNILLAHQGKLEEFRQRIIKIEGLEPAAKDQAIATIADKEKTILQDLDFLIKRGWTGQLERQKLFAQKRQTIIPASNKACHDETAKYFAIANHATSFETYELAEAQYKKHYDSCAKKG